MEGASTLERGPEATVEEGGSGEPPPSAPPPPGVRLGEVVEKWNGYGKKPAALYVFSGDASGVTKVPHILKEAGRGCHPADTKNDPKEWGGPKIYLATMRGKAPWRDFAPETIKQSLPVHLVEPSARSEGSDLGLEG